MPQIGLVILAAGAAARMGQLKQLLPYQGQPLIQHVVTVAQQSCCQQILVVLGAHAAPIQQVLVAHHPAVRMAHNLDWQQGLSSSIRSGVTTLLSQAPDLDAIGLLLCDQPFVSASLINQMIDTYAASQQLIVACEYAGTLGVPALFNRSLFPTLTALTGDQGARQVIQQFRQQVAVISFAEGAVDLDTPADYDRLTQER